MSDKYLVAAMDIQTMISKAIGQAVSSGLPYPDKIDLTSVYNTAALVKMGFDGLHDEAWRISCCLEEWHVEMEENGLLAYPDAEEEEVTLLNIDGYVQLAFKYWVVEADDREILEDLIINHGVERDNAREILQEIKDIELVDFEREHAAAWQEMMTEWSEE